MSPNLLATTRANRVYLLLSFVVAAYYMIAISRGSSFDDVEIAHTQTSPYLPVVRPPCDVSGLLKKHLSTLFTCNIVKLRGVTSNKHDEGRKKPRLNS